MSRDQVAAGCRIQHEQYGAEVPPDTRVPEGRKALWEHRIVRAEVTAVREFAEASRRRHRLG
jgi:hypothetical protein